MSPVSTVTLPVAVVDTHGHVVHRPWRGTTGAHAVVVVHRPVARTLERIRAVGRPDPGHGAAEMRALRVERQQPVVVVDQEELALDVAAAAAHRPAARPRRARSTRCRRRRSCSARGATRIAAAKQRQHRSRPRPARRCAGTGGDPGAPRALPWLCRPSSANTAEAIHPTTRPNSVRRIMNIARVLCQAGIACRTTAVRV